MCSEISFKTGLSDYEYCIISMQLWTTARKNGLISAAYFWPGSEVEGNLILVCRATYTMYTHMYHQL